MADELSIFDKIWAALLTVVAAGAGWFLHSWRKVQSKQAELDRRLVSLEVKHGEDHRRLAVAEHKIDELREDFTELPPPDTRAQLKDFEERIRALERHDIQRNHD